MPESSKAPEMAAPLAARWSRRAALKTALALLTLATSATIMEQDVLAKTSVGTIKEIARGKLGVTFTLSASNAPFPHRSNSDARHRDSTVMVFVPSHYRLPKGRFVDLVVHYHGHNCTAAAVMHKHQLREQLSDSRQNAILVVPQGATNTVDSSFGKLEDQGGLNRLLLEIVRLLRSRKAGKGLKKASLAGAKGLGKVCLSAHSGGYRGAAVGLQRGGCRVREVYLFDSLYGRLAAFESWLLTRRKKDRRDQPKLINHYASADVRKRSLELIGRLKKRGLKVLHERRPGDLTREQLVKGRAVFIASPVGHGDVTFRDNTFRDCLFASCFKRHRDSSWFKNKKKKRKIDSRS